MQECSNTARMRLPQDVLTALRATSHQLQGSASQLAQSVPGDRPLTQDEVKKLWVPLLRLRQACCHPQVSSASCMQPADCCNEV